MRGAVLTAPAVSTLPVDETAEDTSAIEIANIEMLAAAIEAARAKPRLAIVRSCATIILLALNLIALSVIVRLCLESHVALIHRAVWGAAATFGRR